MKYIGNIQSQANAEVFATASGVLPDGKPVVVNSDGTVSVAAAHADSGGSAVIFEAAEVVHVDGAFDSSNNRVVIVYMDGGNSNKGTAVVGSVDPSDNSISFGTAVVFNDAATVNIYVAFDSNANKIVIVYTNQGGTDSIAATGIVGTVDPSDNSISFGSEATFGAGNVDGITFDSSNNKVVAVYGSSADSFHGAAVVGTVSNTSISFGTRVIYEAAGSEHMSVTFDSSNDRVVIAYQDTPDSSKLKGIVGEVSGTGISFGTAVAFFTGGQRTECVFDTTNNKVVITWVKNASPFNGKAIVGTVTASDNSIAFGSEADFDTAQVSDPDIAFDSTAGKVVVIHRASSNSSRPEMTVGTVSGTSISFASNFQLATNGSQHDRCVYDSNSDRTVGFYLNTTTTKGNAVVFRAAGTNLTTENFIGFSDAAYATGQTATIQAGGSINTGQSSLTIGQQYFVQEDGTIDLTADSTSVIAGTAVSATDLIVKG